MKNIEIEWQGEALTIAEDRWFELAEEVEEVITIFEINNFQARPKLAKLARARSIMINFAGGESTPAEVHRSMKEQLGDAKNKDKPDQTIIAQALITLTALLLGIAPEADDAKKPPGDAPGDGGGGQKKTRPKRHPRS